LVDKIRSQDLHVQREFGEKVRASASSDLKTLDLRCRLHSRMVGDQFHQKGEAVGEGEGTEAKEKSSPRNDPISKLHG
jgi:hypothetical protein